MCKHPVMCSLISLVTLDIRKHTTSSVASRVVSWRGRKDTIWGNSFCCRSSEFMLWHSITTSDSLHQWLNMRKWLKYCGSELLSQPSVLCFTVVNHSIYWVSHLTFGLWLTPSIQEDWIMISGQGVVSTVGWCCNNVGLLIYCQYCTILSLDWLS